MFKDYDDSKCADLIQQYRKFLELKAKHSHQLLVPTMNQDLIWHLHQLDNQK